MQLNTSELLAPGNEYPTGNWKWRRFNRDYWQDHPFPWREHLTEDDSKAPEMDGYKPEGVKPEPMDGAAGQGVPGMDKVFADISKIFEKAKRLSAFGRMRRLSELGAGAQKGIRGNQETIRAALTAIVQSGAAGEDMAAQIAAYVHANMVEMYEALEQLRYKVVPRGSQAAKGSDLEESAQAIMHSLAFLYSMTSRVVMRFRTEEFIPGWNQNTNPLNRRRGKFWHVDAATGKPTYYDWQAGTAENLEMFGPTMGEATPAQLSRRIATGYTGQGAYMGRWIGDQIGKRARAIPFVGDFVGDRTGDFVSGLEDRLIDKYRAGGAGQGYRGQGRYEQTIGDCTALGFRDFPDGDYLQMGTTGPLTKMEEFLPREPNGVTGGPSGMEYNGSSFMPDGTVSTRFNDPKFQVNQLINPGNPFTRSHAAMFTAGDDSSDFIIHHREYLRDVTPTTSDFETQLVLELNAGLAESFPTLAKFAQFYNEYRFEQLIVRYRSTLSAGNTNATGTLAIATIYDAGGELYENKQQMENAEFTASGKVSDVVHAGIECDQRDMPHRGNYYVRRTPLGENNSLKLYDMGKIQIVTQGAQPGVNIGDIWVEYRVRLSKLTHTMEYQPLSIGEGACVAMTYPGAVPVGQASVDAWGTPENYSRGNPYPTWVGSTMGGMLHQPGVYRWNATAVNPISAGGQGYVPGQGTMAPFDSSLRSSVPMIAGYSSTPNLGLSLFSQPPPFTVRSRSGVYEFVTVPGAIYSFAYTIQVSYVAGALNTTIVGPDGSTEDYTNVFSNSLESLTTAPIGAPENTSVLSPVGGNIPWGRLKMLVGMGGLIRPSFQNPGVGPRPIIYDVLSGVANAANTDECINSLNNMYNHYVGTGTDTQNRAFPGIMVKPFPSVVGSPQTTPSGMGWGSCVYTLGGQANCRFLTGSNQFHQHFTLVDGGQNSQNTFLIQSAVTFAADSVTGGTCSLRVSPSFPETYSNPYTVGPAFPFQLCSYTQNVGDIGSTIAASFDVGSTTVSFKRIQ